MHVRGAVRAKREAQRVLAPLVAAAVAACAFCSDAQAEVTIGHLATVPIDNCTPEPHSLVQLGAAAVDYTAPVAGAIVSWSTSASPTGSGELGELKVLRPLAAGGFEVLASSAAEPIQAGMNVFKAVLPVQAGDEIGLAYTGQTFACVFGTSDPGDHVGLASGDVPGGGQLGTLSDIASAKLNLSATLLPAPTVAALSPASASISGGTKVVITGTGFAEVGAVTFGTTPAVSFEVESESQITAVAPPSGSLGETNVTVGTPAGSAAAAFTYRGCLVPRLRGKGLAAAKRLLSQAGCRAGALKTPRGKRARRGRVLAQTPRPAAVLPPGAKVSLVLH